MGRLPVEESPFIACDQPNNYIVILENFIRTPKRVILVKELEILSICSSLNYLRHIYTLTTDVKFDILCSKKEEFSRR
jgi:hypothetical protein